ncbi:hypothetical protein F5880DRAFT_1616335 [Lentinula raphanica]|nr:hypothetical protein F5880DRAFT_1616335 [Lentinula raphanica]
MRFHVTCSLQLASVFLGVFPVTASPLPPNSQHSLQKRKKGDSPARIGLFGEEDWVNVRDESVSIAKKQQGHISFGAGPFKWIVYPDGDKKPFLAEPPKPEGADQLDPDYYERSGMVLYPDIRKLNEKIVNDVHYPILLDRKQLASYMTPEIIGVLQSKGVDFEYDIRDGKSCYFAALAYFAHIRYLVDSQDLHESIFVKHILSVLDKVKPPLSPRGTRPAAGLPHDSSAPNPHSKGSNPAPQRFTSTTEPNAALPHDPSAPNPHSEGRVPAPQHFAPSTTNLGSALVPENPDNVGHLNNLHPSAPVAPLRSSANAASVPHDPIVPNPRVDGSSPAPQHFAPSTSNPSPALPEDTNNLHNPYPQADNWKENAASWKPSLGNILYDPTVLEHSRASKPAM